MRNPSDKGPGVRLLGVPNDANSSFMKGAAEAPPAIRRALHSPSSNLSTESGLDLGGELSSLRMGTSGRTFRDAGDLPRDVPFADVTEAVSGLLENGDRVLSLGGDHAIAYPILQAYGRRFPRLNLLQLDAHPDLYDELDGNRLSHACPFARIMEDGLAARLVQVGIRTLNPHQREQAARFGVEIHEMKDWPLAGSLDFDGPLYLSLDLDVFDPAFAPGVSHHEPGGLSVREVITLIQNLEAPLVGADVVELNPARDPSGVTAMVAAKLVKEIAARMLETD